jgi:hypothetical protein
MTWDALVERLAESIDPAGAQLAADFRAGLVQAVLPGPGHEQARSLGATFAVRAKTSAAAGIRTLGLETTVSRLNALAPETSVLLFHFSGNRRVFSVFVDEVDEQIIGVVMVDRAREPA